MYALLQAVVREDLSKYPPDSDKQQAAVLAIADNDGFNWGYDPVGTLWAVIACSCMCFT
jgi:hypothetical protein